MSPMWLEFVEERSSLDTVPLSAEQLQQAVRFFYLGSPRRELTHSAFGV